MIALAYFQPGDFLLLSPRLECAACMLRPWTLADRAALVRHANDRDVWRNLRDLFPHPYTETDADAWLARAGSDPPPRGVYAIEVDGEAAGTISVHAGADIERCSAEIGYWLGRRYWGRGIMTNAVSTVTAAALGEPDLLRLFAAVFAWNLASMRVLEKNGYQREGVLVRSGVKDGAVIDRVLYAITRAPGGPYASVDFRGVPAVG